MAGQIDDRRRQHLEQALAAALLLLYRGHAREAMDRLGVLGSDVVVSPDVQAAMTAFVTDRAQKVQTGINTRLDRAAAQNQDGTWGPAHDATRDEAQARARAEIHDYNRDVLMPFLASWARHQALIDTYRATPDPMGSGTTALAATTWTWVQRTGYFDDCSLADEASPASYDELIAIAGAPPPAHERCQCSLSPS